MCNYPRFVGKLAASVAHGAVQGAARTTGVATGVAIATFGSVAGVGVAAASNLLRAVAVRTFEAMPDIDRQLTPPSYMPLTRTHTSQAMSWTSENDE
mmetsp:Transcript_46681/g.111018  ORF Transcript_46681/g.111018 Transcript_46681/m.111018 type:complete len:97 (-) Transcript_46681:359-649(-)|eukprot:CAMPEP_0178419026 /NCGR_PEP_ID=MMETSP0689_2-20121128/25393_1 /TAXON_ID=160604 /ORGANISM="Amphidinium massartii, Strain CS-259" /LENGTH=96 /DNA_ID=CAMNT_0020040441 /DNA_START=37 /DNA_END=327 /DNA_ORIENTATION=-